jgi:hypothetical protein
MGDKMINNLFADLIPQPKETSGAQGGVSNPFSDPVLRNSQVVAKTSNVTNDQSPDLTDASFKKGPSTGGIEPNYFERMLNGAMKPIGGAEQLIARGVKYLDPSGITTPALAEVSDQWAKAADARARDVSAYGEDLTRYAGVNPQTHTDWYNLAGQGLSPANFMAGGGAVKAARSLPVIGETIAGSNILKGAVGGGAMSATEPVTSGDYASEKEKQIAIGMGSGGVAGGVIGKAGAVIKPRIDAAVQALADEGVRLTPGQIMGGVVKRLEDALQSYPIVGSLIRNSRERSLNDFQVAAANRALEPIGEKVTGKVATGPELVEHVNSKIGAVFNRVLPQTTLAMDNGLAQDVKSIIADASGWLPTQELNQLQNIIRAQVMGKISTSGGQAPGELVQTMTSRLGGLAKDYRTGMGGEDKRMLGEYLSQAKGAVEDAIIRQNPHVAGELKQAKKAWSLYKRVEDAAARQGGEVGQFSPAQLEMAAKKGVTQFTKAKGGAPLQDLATAAKKVLPSKVPDSGTPERTFALGLGGYMAHAAQPSTLAVPAAIAALYNPVGEKVLRAALMSRPKGAQALRDFIDRNSQEAAGRIALYGQGDR